MKTKLKKSAAVESEASTLPQPQPTLKCHKCPVMFMAEKALKMHLKEKHSKKKLEHTCPTCSKGFLYKSRLLEHLPKHSQELNFQCDFCEKAFKTQQARGQHMRIAHKEFEYCCPICQQIFQSCATLNRHTKEQHGQARFACDVCGRHFRAQHAFTSHKCPTEEEEQQEEEQEPQEGNTILTMCFPDKDAGSDYEPSSPAGSSDSTPIDPADVQEELLLLTKEVEAAAKAELASLETTESKVGHSNRGGDMPGSIEADQLIDDPSDDQLSQEPKEPIDSSAPDDEELDRTYSLTTSAESGEPVTSSPTSPDEDLRAHATDDSGRGDKAYEVESSLDATKFKMYVCKECGAAFITREVLRLHTCQ